MSLRNFQSPIASHSSGNGTAAISCTAARCHARFVDALASSEEKSRCQIPREFEVRLHGGFCRSAGRSRGIKGRTGADSKTSRSAFEPDIVLGSAILVKLPMTPASCRGFGARRPAGGIPWHTRGYQPLILERDPMVKSESPRYAQFDRGGSFDGENNYLFGEGGAGCFSDGKLTCRLEGPDVEWVLERFGSNAEDDNPSSTKTDRIWEAASYLSSAAISAGRSNPWEENTALGAAWRGSIFVMVKYAVFRHPADTSQPIMSCWGSVTAAPGYHQMLFDLGVPMIQKAFQLGLRIEQPQEQINKHKYARPEYLSLLGAADYTLNARGERDVFTFCMCAGGIIIPSISEPGMFCSNGMSNSMHDTPFANSGVMVTLEPGEFGSDHPLAGVHLQQRY